MIDDKVIDKIEKKNFHEQKAKELSQIVKTAMPFLDKVMLGVTKNYDKNMYSVTVTYRTWTVACSGNIGLCVTGFEVEPILDKNGSLKGISVYTSDLEEKGTSSYNMAKKFVKRFEEKYPGRYKIEIKYKGEEKTQTLEKITTDYLEAEIPKNAELTKIMKSISNIGNDLLYSHTENEVTRMILDQYRFDIEGYLEKAGEYAENYRNSTQYLKSFNLQEIKQDIKVLSKKVKRGEKDYEKTLKEKKDTLKNIQTIRKNKKRIKTSLLETQATLESLRASVITVETAEDKEKVMEDIQRSISTLSKALDKTFGEPEQEKIIEEVIDDR